MPRFFVLICLPFSIVFGGLGTNTLGYPCFFDSLKNVTEL